MPYTEANAQAKEHHLFRMKCFLREIQKAEDKLTSAKKKLLKETGWEYTCATPGAIWVWQKKSADGRIVVASESMAINFITNEYVF